MNLATRILTTAALATVPILAAAPAALAHDDVETDVKAEVNVESDDEDDLTIEIILDLGEDEELLGELL